MFNTEFIRKLFIFIIFSELVSLFSFMFPSTQIIAYFTITLIFLFFALKDLKYAIWLLLIELILGSKGGYLFSINFNDYLVSIRITFWIIFLSVWFGKYILPGIFKKNIIKQFQLEKFQLKYFGIILIFVTWALLNGLLKNNNLLNIFFDFNAYLYFLIIFPLFHYLQNLNTDDFKRFIHKSTAVLLAAVSYLSFKTLLLLFMFSHKLESINSLLYKWVRDTGVGEITKMSGGFYRIFFQSHIFVIIALLFVFIFLISRLNNHKSSLKNIFTDKQTIALFLLSLLFSVVSMISMSRTNWLGILFSLVLIFFYVLFKNKFRGGLNFILLSFTTFVLSFVLIIVIVKFPIPKPIDGLATSDIFSDRAIDIKDEAGVSSRWNLLPELAKAIWKSPIAGGGFGATVTYISNDPRVRSINPSGEYTTFAFEWGWLDIFLKLGILGFFAYSFLLFIILKISFKEFIKIDSRNAEIYFGIFIVIVAISVINFFSPYLNHPLGIGLIVLVCILTEYELMASKTNNNASIQAPLAKI